MKMKANNKKQASVYYLSICKGSNVTFPDIFISVSATDSLSSANGCCTFSVKKKKMF